MAEMNSLPAPRVRAHPVGVFWRCIWRPPGSLSCWGWRSAGTSPRVVIAGIGSMLGRLGVASDAFGSNVAQGLSGTNPGLAAFGRGRADYRYRYSMRVRAAVFRRFARG